MARLTDPHPPAGAASSVHNQQNVTEESVMSSNHPAPSNVDPGRQPAPAPSEHLQLRRLEKTGGWTRHERLRMAWYRLRLTVQEMNYATRRLVELQTRLP
jgi:hypothetical protein